MKTLNLYMNYNEAIQRIKLWETIYNKNSKIIIDIKDEPIFHVFIKIISR